MTTATTASIDLEQIRTGDELLIRHDRNRLAVTAVCDPDKITAATFNTTIVIATRYPSGRWKQAPRVHVDGHQPAIPFN